MVFFQLVNRFVVLDLKPGSFATVYVGRHCDTGQLVAIKSVNKDRVLANAKHKQNLDHEIAIMQQMRHPNIVRLLEKREVRLCFFSCSRSVNRH